MPRQTPRISKINGGVLVFASLLALTVAAGSACAQEVRNLNLTSSREDVVGMTDLELAEKSAEQSPTPPALSDLQGKFAPEDESEQEARSAAMGLQIRADALREAGLSYGARGGLAARTYEIQRRLAEYDSSLTKAFDFRRLLISASSGLLVEPPVVSEAQKAVLVSGGGQAAAVADRVYRINRGARIVTASRDWHLYLERDWGKVEPPPTILLPKDEEEQELWKNNVQKGWNEGVKQADEIFESDVDRMINDFTGMIRYRELLAQGMITAPYTLADDRGITGGGNEMRVGDRGVTITGQSALISRSNTWTPADR